MIQTIKTYNLFHSIWDKLIFGFAVPVVIILFHALVSLELAEMTITFTVVYTMYSEVMRDYFIFNGIYSRDSHHLILRSSYNGKKLFLRGIMSEHMRSLIHLFAVVMICTVITSILNKPDLYYFPVNVIITLTAYALYTISINIVRYFDNFTLYPFIATPFIILAILCAIALTFTGIKLGTPLLILFIALAVVLSILVTALSYLHAKRCYENSFYDKGN